MRALRSFNEFWIGAYERIALKVCEGPQGDTTKRILGWMACAARSLRWREIQSLLCIYPDQGECHHDCLLVEGCKTICGSFIDIDNDGGLSPDPDSVQQSDSSLHFVHPTVLRYLIDSGRVESLKALHQSMADYCTRYLSSKPFHRSLGADEKERYALSGYYGLQDYAVSSWDHHILYCLHRIEAHSPDLLPASLPHTLNILQHIYEPSVPSVKSSNAIELSGNHAVTSHIVRDWLRSYDRSSMERRTSEVRQVIDSIKPEALDEIPRRIFLALQGRLKFKCPKSSCQNFHNGFTSRDAQTQHVREHERPFKCTQPGCTLATIGFPSQTLLDDHVKRLHAPKPLFPPHRVSKAGWGKDNEPELLVACRLGGIDFVKAQCPPDFDFNAQSRAWRECLLGAATQNQRLDVCEFLVKGGMDPFINPTSRRKSTPRPSSLTLSIKKRDYTMFALLFHNALPKSRKWLDQDGSSSVMAVLVHLALRNRTREILEDLLEYLLKTGKNGDWLFKVIADVECSWRDTDIPTFSLLLRRLGEDTRSILLRKLSSGRLFFHRLVRSANLALVEYVIAFLHPRDLLVEDSEGLNTFSQATTMDASMFRVLVQFGMANLPTNVDSKGKSVLHHAYLDMSMRVELFEFDLPISEATRETINCQDEDGRTPLHVAINVSNLEAVKQLLRTGQIELSLRDAEGLTPFLCSLGSATIIPFSAGGTMQLLYDYDSSLLNTKSEDGRTVFGYVANKCDKIPYPFFPGVQFLLSLPEGGRLVEEEVRSDMPIVRLEACCRQVIRYDHKSIHQSINSLMGCPDLKDLQGLDQDLVSALTKDVKVLKSIEAQNAIRTIAILVAGNPVFASYCDERWTKIESIGEDSHAAKMMKEDEVIHSLTMGLVFWYIRQQLVNVPFALQAIAFLRGRKVENPVLELLPEGYLAIQRAILDKKLLVGYMAYEEQQAFTNLAYGQAFGRDDEEVIDFLNNEFPTIKGADEDEGIL